MWYALIDGEQNGPMTDDAVRELVLVGVIDADTYLWKKGMDEWEPLAQILDFVDLVAQEAPPAESDPRALRAQRRAAAGATPMSASPDANPPPSPGTGRSQLDDGLFSRPPSAQTPEVAAPLDPASFSVEAPPTAEPVELLEDPGEPIEPELLELEPEGLELEPGAASTDEEDVPDGSMGSFVYKPMEMSAPFEAPSLVPEEEDTGTGRRVMVGLVLIALGVAAGSGFLYWRNVQQKQRLAAPVVAAAPSGETAAAGAPGSVDAGVVAADAARAGAADVGVGTIGAAGGTGDAAAGPNDAGPNGAGPNDAGPKGAGPNDAGPNDAGPNDAGPNDAGPKGAGPPDGAPAVAAAPQTPKKPKRRWTWKPKPKPKPEPTTGPAAPTPTAPAKPKAGRTTLSRGDLTGVIRGAKAQIQACAAKEGGQKGTVAVATVIERSGRVRSAKVVTGRYRKTPAGACVEEVVKGLTFPAFDGDPMRVNLPLYF